MGSRPCPSDEAGEQKPAVIGDQAHQLLHGYRSGHGQIAGSVKLAARDSELVTRLSDLSGSLSSGLQVESYLTVYPLPSQNFFALARTWPDPDAPRAGCVLTHTLLVPVERWAALANIRSLDDLFRNPHSHPEYAFTEPINLPSKAQIVTPRDFSLDLPRSRAFVSAILGRGCDLLFGSMRGNLKSICGDFWNISGPNSGVHSRAAHSVCNSALFKIGPSTCFSRLRQFIRGSRSYQPNTSLSRPWNEKSCRRTLSRGHNIGLKRSFLPI